MGIIKKTKIDTNLQQPHKLNKNTEYVMAGIQCEIISESEKEIEKLYSNSLIVFKFKAVNSKWENKREYEWASPLTLVDPINIGSHRAFSGIKLVGRKEFNILQDDEFSAEMVLGGGYFPDPDCEEIKVRFILRGLLFFEETEDEQ